MISQALLLTALATPMALLLGCLFVRFKKGTQALLALAPLPALAAALVCVESPPLVLDHVLYRVTLTLDRAGAMLLGAAALLWIAAGIYAPAFLQSRPNSGRFTACWLLTLTGCLGIFMAADLASFLLFYALVSLPAYGLVVHEGTPSARRAGALYIGFPFLGEGLL